MKLNEDQHSVEVTSRENHKLLKSQEQNVQQFRNEFTFVSQTLVSQIQHKQQLHLIQKFPVIWTLVNGRM